MTKELLLFLSLEKLMVNRKIEILVVKIDYKKKDEYLFGHRGYWVYTKKFLIEVFLLVGIPVPLCKCIK